MSLRNSLLGAALVLWTALLPPPSDFLLPWRAAAEAASAASASEPIGGTTAGMGIHSTAGTEIGTAVGWGSDGDGESFLGEAARGREVSAGLFHTCVLGADGRPSCRGCAQEAHDFGQCDARVLPSGWSLSLGGRRTSDLPVSGMSSAKGHTCAIDSNLDVQCWGCQVPFQRHQCDIPKGLKALRGDAGAVAAGDLHTCAAGSDGKVSCWGCERNDQRSKCRPPEDLFGVVFVAVGTQHSCAVAGEGRVRCWGDDAGGKASPPEDLRAESLFLGPDTSCAREKGRAGDAGTEAGGGGSNRIRCWGKGAAEVETLAEGADAVAFGEEGRACARGTERALACGGCKDPADPFCAVPNAAKAFVAAAAAHGRHGSAVVLSGAERFPKAEEKARRRRSDDAAERPALGPSEAWISKTGDFRHASGLRFKTVPAGAFKMGSCAADERTAEENLRRRRAGLPPVDAACPFGEKAEAGAYAAEGPVHEVRIDAPFQISVFETTVGDWRKFLAGTGRTPDPEWEENNRRPDRYPAVWISWHDAKSFAEWLNRSKAADDPGIYRLPSEAEWEYAARAGTHTRFPWGDEAGRGTANCATCAAEGGGGTLPVGRFPPNGFGLYDVAGNVDEWVEDCFVPTYEGAPDDGSARRDGACAERPARGGSWEYPEDAIRSGWRDDYLPSAKTDEQGVRILRELPKRP